MQECSEFVCYADIQSEDDTCAHFSLGLPYYVQFTSPIRRYMDIVVHRFVVAALDNLPAPYTVDEVTSRRLHLKLTTDYSLASSQDNSFEYISGPLGARLPLFRAIRPQYAVLVITVFFCPKYCIHL